MDRETYRFYFVLLLAVTVISVATPDLATWFSTTPLCQSNTSNCETIILSTAVNFLVMAMVLLPLSLAVILYQRFNWLGFNKWWFRGILIWLIVATDTLFKDYTGPNDPVSDVVGIPLHIMLMLILSLYFCFAEKQKPFQYGLATHIAWAIAGVQAALATQSTLLPYGWILVCIFGTCLGYLWLEQYQFNRRWQGA